MMPAVQRPAGRKSKRGTERGCVRPCAMGGLNQRHRWAEEGCAPPRGLLRDASLFLDFDGTLVNIAEAPDAVQVSDALRALLAELAGRLDGRLAIISGRAAGDVRAQFGDASFTIAGSHGAEVHHVDGRREVAAQPPGYESVLAAMERLAGAWPGVLVERKPLGLALHYRRCPEAEATCVALARELAEHHGLTLQPGKMVIELRGAGGDKGSALRLLMQQPGWADTRPVFLGDDATDEPAFTAADELGGAGVLVGPVRPTAARYRLPDVDAVLAWLAEEARA